ncbi:MAG: CoA transferase [Dehalococcoidia bacterium]|nr:CoA transferase [Dehalococcoidia bacterium]
MTTILHGLRVLDFTEGMAGSMATMILADNGATVVKVERPGGDPYRSMPAWRMWNRGKQSVVLDLTTSAGRAEAQRLAVQTDVLVENFLPGQADAAGLAYEALRGGNPRLIHCSITAFGPKGAYAGLPCHDGIVQAKSGGLVAMRDQLKRSDAPAVRARPQASYSTANLAAQGIVGALRVREHTGRGQRVETSLFQGFSVYDFNSSVRRQVELGTAKLHGAQMRATLTPAAVNFPYMVVRCKDGLWIQMANMAARLFPNWIAAMGLQHLYQDPRFKGMPFTYANDADRIALQRILIQRMLEKNSTEWLELFLKHDVGGDYILTTQQFLDHPQNAYNGGVIEILDPEVGATRQIGPIAQFSRTPAVTITPAPRLGEHTQLALHAPQRRPARPASRTNGAQPRRPLDGLTLVEFGNWLAAPSGTALIADLGARVIKVEPATGDEFRPLSAGRARTFQGKESVAVDLKTAEGKEIARRLVKSAHAVMHNLRGDAPKRIGIDEASVRSINPNVVYVYAGSYGATGPGAGRPAFHPIAGCMTGGVRWQLGKGNEPPPPDVPLSTDEVIRYSLALYRANEGSPDVSSGIGLATAMTLALYHRDRTGEGQRVETTMLTANAYVTSDDMIRYAGKPPRLELDSELRGFHALDRLYHTAEGWVYLACVTQEDWTRLCRALGRDDLLAGARFADAAARQRHDDALIALLAEAFRAKPAAAWERELCAKGVACVRADAMGIEDFFLTDPSVQENGMIVEVERPTVGRFRRQAPGVRFSETPGCAEPPHTFGEDTAPVLRELGYTDAEIEAMRARGIIVCHEMQRVG